MKITHKLSTLLEPKSIIFGVAVLNFALIYLMAAERMDESFPQGRPWYAEGPLTHYPLILLLAAFCLWLNKSWSNLLALVLCGSIFYRGLAFALHLILNPEHPWMISMSVRELLLPQFVLSAVIFCYAAICLGRDVHRWHRLSRHGV